MHKIEDVLRLKLDARLSHEQIAGALRISKGAVAKYAGLAAAAGIDRITASTLDEVALEQRLLTKPAKQSAYALPVRRQHLRRKVLQVERDDRARAAANRCSQHMHVIGIGQCDPLGDRFIAVDEAIRHGIVHQLARARQRFSTVRAFEQHGTHPLVMDALGPACPVRRSGPGRLGSRAVVPGKERRRRRRR